jgi:hypothetical protein
MTAKKSLQLTAIGGLENENRVRILGVIDQLRELGVGENVSLPQVRTRYPDSRCTTYPNPARCRRRPV